MNKPLEMDKSNRKSCVCCVVSVVPQILTEGSLNGHIGMDNDTGYE